MSKALLKILKDAQKFGGIHLSANKQCGKSNAKKVLASLAIRSLNAKVVITDTVGKWKYDFVNVPYYTIKANSLRITEKPLGAEVRKTYDFRNEQTKKEVNYLLDSKSPILFDLELEYPEELGYFNGYIMLYLYRKQRKLNNYWKGKLRNSYLIFIEEIENVFNSTFDKRILSRHAKVYNEIGNYRIGIVSSSQRLTEVNIKFRAKAYAYLIGCSSLTDYHNRLRSMLRHSQHKSQITKLERGNFLYTATDTIVKFPKFETIETPYELPIGFLKEKPKPKPIKISLKEKLKRLAHQLVYGVEKPRKGNRHTNRQDTDEDAQDEDLGAEHSLLASNEDEETESLFFP